MLLIVIIAFLFSTLSNAGTVLDGIRTVFIESDYPLAVSQLTNELRRLGIAVVERREVDKLFHEQRFRLQHGSDADTDRMRVGEMAGADALLSLEVRAGNDVIRHLPAEGELRQDIEGRLNALKIAAGVDLYPKPPRQPPGISFWDWQADSANRTPGYPPLLPKLNALNTLLQIGGVEKTIGINEYYADGADWETVLLHDPTTSPNWEEANDRLIRLHPGLTQKIATGRLPNWKEIVEREHQRQHAESLEATKRRSTIISKPQNVSVHIRVISVETGRVLAMASRGTLGGATNWSKALISSFSVSYKMSSGSTSVSPLDRLSDARPIVGGSSARTRSPARASVKTMPRRSLKDARTNEKMISCRRRCYRKRPTTRLRTKSLRSRNRC